MTETFPGTKTPLYALMGTVMSHLVDFSSVALLKRMLPYNEKNIILKPSLKDMSEVIDVVGMRDLKNMVLIIGMIGQ
jgi:hypothetical protein